MWTDASRTDFKRARPGAAADPVRALTMHGCISENWASCWVGGLIITAGNERARLDKGLWLRDSFICCWVGWLVENKAWTEMDQIGSLLLRTT